MRHEDKVVVLLTPQVLTHQSGQVVAARFRKLGLTAYAKTEDVALERLRQMFAAFIRNLRDSGHLVQRLEQAGVRWYRVTDFEQLGRPYEDLTRPHGQRRVVPTAAVSAAPGTGDSATRTPQWSVAIDDQAPIAA